MILQRRWLVLAACVAALAVPAADAAAQRTGAGLPPPDPRLSALGMNPAEVLAQLRESGMTRQQVRSELQRRGYDPFLADPYFDILEQETGGRQTSFLDALGRAGLAQRDSAGAAQADRPRADSRLRDFDVDALFGRADSVATRPRELPVFGRSFFERGLGTVADSEFGPVDASYRLGAGDEVNVILTGAVQDAYPLQVSREGTLVVPELGEMVVRGLTLGGLESVLRRRVSEVYASGLTNVSVALGRVRSIQVNVVGDVDQPGPYQVSGLSTVLGALYRAGGPSNTGSFRAIEVRRNNEVVRRLDLYEYLLHGNSAVDPRLQQGDVVFVPPFTRRVRLEGAVKRPAIYELVDGDGLRDAIRFAGGPEAEASLRRVEINRILSPLERTPGVEREIIDVDVVALLAPGTPDVLLRDGDRVHVYSVTDELRNMVTIVGEVRRPGTYAWAAGTTLGDVVDRASGMTEAAYLGRAHVFRLDPATGSRRLVSAPLEADLRGVMLAERDSIVIYSRDSLRPAERVTIGGQVQEPGEYRLTEGATVNDIILRAGGYADGAWQLEAYVARPSRTAERTVETAQTFRVPLAAARADAADGAPAWVPAADEFVLRNGDHVEIRRAPGYEEPRTVVVTGEVVLPGTYVLASREDRVSRLLAEAGGLTSDAQASGLHVVRDGQAVAADAAAALSRAGSVDDLVLQDGDTVRVPRFDPTVLVTGAVVHDSTRVVYRPGMDVDDLVAAAGGYRSDADRGRVTVTYQNGQRGTVQRLALQRDRPPEARPGSTIHVPERAGAATNWTTVISQLVGAVGAIATLIIALNSIP